VADADCQQSYVCIEQHCLAPGVIGEGEGENVGEGEGEGEGEGAEGEGENIGEGEGEGEIPCGDGQLDNSEACDDGNRTDGDGCNTVCAIEPGYACLAPGRCAPHQQPPACPDANGDADDDDADIDGDCRADFVVAGPSAVVIYLDRPVDNSRDWVAEPIADNGITAIGVERDRGPDGRRAVFIARPSTTSLLVRHCIGDPCFADVDSDGDISRASVGFPGVFASLPGSTTQAGQLLIGTSNGLRLGAGDPGIGGAGSFADDDTTVVAANTPAFVRVAIDTNGDQVPELLLVSGDGVATVVDGLSLTELTSVLLGFDPIAIAVAADGRMAIAHDDGVEVRTVIEPTLVVESFPVQAVVSLAWLRRADRSLALMGGMPSRNIDEGEIVLLHNGADVPCGAGIDASRYGTSMRSLGRSNGDALMVVGAPGVSRVQVVTVAINTIGSCASAAVTAPGVGGDAALGYGTFIASSQ
jgi:cysteine-rich repeat protein